jgi:CheY-like chemotaxis protein
MTDTEGARSQPPACVLIVDDQDDARQTLAEILELEGYEVAGVADGVEAWDYLEQKQLERKLPEVILLDLMMPRMNGQEFRERQLADPRLRDIPVVVVSGADRTEQNLSGLGAIDYFIKPVDCERLLAVVERFCRPGV